MARTRKDPSDETDTAQARPPSDVLVYLDQAGGSGCNWYSNAEGADGKPKVPTMGRHVIGPRLHIIPAAVWADVQRTGGYKQPKGVGLLELVAGHGGDLEGEWATSAAGALVRKIEKSHNVVVLQRLQAMESAAADPRHKVSEALDVRLDELKILVAKTKRKRDAKRRANRSRRRAA